MLMAPPPLEEFYVIMGAMKATEDNVLWYLLDQVPYTDNLCQFLCFGFSLAGIMGFK